VRDAAGAPAGLKMAVERGIIAGPRMQVAISLISQTGGHGDGFYPCCADIGFFGGRFTDIPNGVVNGVEEVRTAVREVLRPGADLVPTLIAPLSVIEFSQGHPDLLPPMMAVKAVSVVEAHQKSFRMAVEAGVKIAMGTDSGVGRHGENGKELQLMVKNGMTPMQAIVASTANAAQLLHLDGMVGTLEEGKVADVIVVGGEVYGDMREMGD